MVTAKVLRVKLIINSLYKRLKKYNERVKVIEQLIDRDIESGKVEKKNKQNLLLQAKKGLMKDFFGGFLTKRKLNKMLSLREALIKKNKKPDSTTLYNYNLLIKTLYPDRKDLFWNWP